MKIGIISDIHGNLRALEAILEYFRKLNVDTIISLGDNIGYYHQSIEVLDLIKEKNIFTIMGNHEAYLIRKLECSDEKWRIIFLQNLKENLSNKELNWISNFPLTYEINTDSSKIALFHGSPWNPLEEYIYPNSEKINNFNNLPWDYIFLGHTHISMLKKLENKYIINPGSCGQSRDGDLRASAITIDTYSNDISFIKENYEIQLTIKEAINSGVSEEAIKKLKGE